MSLLAFFSLLIAALTYAASLPRSNSPRHSRTESSTPYSAQEIVKLMGMGWNLGNTLDGFDTDVSKSSETSWGNPVVTRELLQAVKQLGFASIRVPVTYHTRFEADEVTVKAAWLDRVEQVIDWCLELDFFVVTNVHHDSWTWADFSQSDNLKQREARFLKLWDQLAARFQDKSYNLIFEPLNEPVGKDEAAGKEYNQLFQQWINKIRKSGGKNAGRHLTIPSMRTAQDTLQYVKIEDDNWSLHIHLYDPYPFVQHAWGNTKWGSEDEKQAIINIMEDTLKVNPAVILGEYSIPETKIAIRGSKRRWYTWYGLLLQHFGIAGMLWDNGSMLDRQSLTWLKPHESLNVLMDNDSAQIENGTVYLEQNGNYSPIELKFKAVIGLKNGSRTNIKNMLKQIDPPMSTQIRTDGKTTIVPLSQSLVKSLQRRSTGLAAEYEFSFEKGPSIIVPIIVYTHPTTSKSTITLSKHQNQDYVIPIDFHGSELAGIRAMFADSKQIKCAIEQEEFTAQFGPHSHCFLTYDYYWTFDDQGIALRSIFLTNVNTSQVRLTFDFEPRDENQLEIILNLT